MSQAEIQEQQQQRLGEIVHQQQQSKTKTSSPTSSGTQSPDSSISNSISLIKLDELSSFGATKQSRLPALIRLTPIDQNNTGEQEAQRVNSMPNFEAASELEKTSASTSTGHQQKSLPIELLQTTMASVTNETNSGVALAQQANKENLEQQQQQQQLSQATDKQQTNAPSSGDFQIVDMDDEDDASNGGQNVVGPSLPQMTNAETVTRQQVEKSLIYEALGQQPNSQAPVTGHLGDSLIEMIINLRNENQNLVRALETNNDYVKERLEEFKRVQEESKRREAQFAMEKAEHEHQVRKLQRQNSVLSERLKSMETKLKEMKLEINESLSAAHSSKASSLQADGQAAASQLYPQLSATVDESFSNPAYASGDGANAQQEPATMQVDATRGELYNDTDAQATTSDSVGAKRISEMNRDELSEHFDAKKAEFYAIDDPMKQCDKLEQQLNDIGKRDYEICLLQQQLNIYRQDFRLERMEKLEAKIQIEKLKNDIDRLCLERLQAARKDHDERDEHATEEANRHGRHNHRPSLTDAPGLVGKLGHHLGKKAARSAVKAAKYAAKQAHLEEKAAAALARAASYRNPSSSAPAPSSNLETTPKVQATDQIPQGNASDAHHLNSHHHSHHHHHRRHRSRGGNSSGIKSEIVNDLMSTANKAMLTGYKVASTHVNLALDKLSQFEQQQANHLDKNKRGCGASAPPMDQAPSID